MAKDGGDFGLSVQGKKKILILLTNHSAYPTRSDQTGLWVTELTHFYDAMAEKGYEMDFASPRGGKIPLDERSLSWIYMDAAARSHLQDPNFSTRLQTTKAASEVDPRDYCAVYFTGGHGTMWDFRDNKDFKAVSEAIYNQGGYVTSVCHGAAGLLNLKDPEGAPLIAGKRVTGFSNTEEWLAGLRKEVPFSLQDDLSALGAHYEKAVFPFTPFAVRDGRIITGQNPQSGQAVADELMAALADRK